MIDLDTWANIVALDFWTPEGPTVNPQYQQHWPFPTKSNPLKPWTPEQVKEHKEKNTQEAPF